MGNGISELRHDVDADATTDHVAQVRNNDRAGHADTGALQACAGLTTQLHAWLARINMSQFEAELRRVGCEVVDDLCDIEMGDLEGTSLTRLQKKRLLRASAILAKGQTYSKTSAN